MYNQVAKGINEKIFSHLPHNYLNYIHCGIVQSIEKVHQHLSFFSHFPNNDSEDKTKDYQSEHINTIRIQAHYFVFFSFVL